MGSNCNYDTNAPHQGAHYNLSTNLSDVSLVILCVLYLLINKDFYAIIIHTVRAVLLKKAQTTESPEGLSVPALTAKSEIAAVVKIVQIILCAQVVFLQKSMPLDTIKLKVTLQRKRGVLWIY